MNNFQFGSFENLFEELVEAIGRDQEAADARVQPWQAEIKPGDYFRKPSGWDFPIYGEVLMESDARELWPKHYRLCRTHSSSSPNGTVSHIHVSTIERLLSREQFEAARQQGWYP